jgi:hypothetical protein
MTPVHSPSYFVVRGIAALALLTAMAACSSNNNNSTSTTPTTPVNLTTETFTGTVNSGGNDFKTFTVTQAGELDITLTQVGPPATISVGLGLGQPSAGTCQFTIPNAYGTVQAGSTPQISGTANAGQFCVEVYDVGNIQAPITYTVTVVHP